MQLIPWRVKNFISQHFPLAYHLLANGLNGGNSPDYWDNCLAESWNHAARQWPARAALIASALDPSMSILDIGCGTGSLMRGLRARGFHNLHGVEISRYAVQRLCAEGYPMTNSSALAIPLPSDSFDAVIASEVLEHMIRRGRFVREIVRLLKPGGKALIFVPDNCLGPIDEPEHVIKYTARSLQRFLGSFLTVESVTSTHEPGRETSCLFAVCVRPRG